MKIIIVLHSQQQMFNTSFNKQTQKTQNGNVQNV